MLSFVGMKMPIFLILKPIFGFKHKPGFRVSLLNPGLGFKVWVLQSLSIMNPWPQLFIIKKVFSLYKKQNNLMRRLQTSSNLEGSLFESRLIDSCTRADGQALPFAPMPGKKICQVRKRSNLDKNYRQGILAGRGTLLLSALSEYTANQVCESLVLVLDSEIPSVLQATLQVS